MKYKAGDTVRVKSKAWFDAQEKNKDKYINRKHGYVNRGCYFGKKLIIDTVEDGFYYVKNNAWPWEDWMLETSAPKHTIQRRKFSPINRVIY